MLARACVRTATKIAHFYVNFMCPLTPFNVNAWKCRSCLQKRLFSTCSPCLTLIGARGFKFIKNIAPTHVVPWPKCFAPIFHMIVSMKWIKKTFFNIFWNIFWKIFFGKKYFFQKYFFPKIFFSKKYFFQKKLFSGF